MAEPDTTAIDRVTERLGAASTPAEVGQIARIALNTPDLTPQQRTDFQQMFSSRTTKLMADPNSEDVQRITELAMTNLELNPRAIKRCFRLVRVLRNIQIATGAARNPDTDRRIVLRAAHLLMNWPQFAQWLRDHPSMLDEGTRMSSGRVSCRRSSEMTSRRASWTLTYTNSFAEWRLSALRFPRCTPRACFENSGCSFGERLLALGDAPQQAVHVRRSQNCEMASLLILALRSEFIFRHSALEFPLP